MSSLLQAGVARSSAEVHAGRLATPAVPVTPVREGILQLDQALPLHLGGRLDGVRVAWRVTGNPSGPLVAALGGISAGRTVADWASAKKAGGATSSDRARRSIPIATRCWASTFSAAAARRPGRARGRPISLDQHVRPGRSSAPGRRASRVAHLAAIVGASYGGMVALAFAERYPQLVKHAVAISAADRAHPMATAWRSVQRAVVRYAAQARRGARRAAARARAGDGDLSQPGGVRSASAAQPHASTGASSSRSSRICWRAAMPTPRRTFPKRSCACRSPSTCIRSMPRASACRRHWLRSSKISSCRSRTCARCRRVSAGAAELVEISSLYGHDAFLKEAAALQPVFARALQGRRCVMTQRVLRDHARGARSARVRHSARGGRSADPSDLDVRVQVVRREADLRLHALRQSDARCAGRGDGRARRRARCGRHFVRHVGGASGRAAARQRTIC